MRKGRNKVVRTQESILERVTKLLAQAEDSAATPDERDTATRLATVLLRRHEIDQAMLDEHNGKSTDELIVKDIGVKPDASKPRGYAKTKYTRATAQMIVDVARANGLKTPYWQPSFGTVEVAGWKSDVERTEFLLASLMIQLFEAKKAWAAQVKEIRGGSDAWDGRGYATTKEHNDFITGFGVGAARVIRNARKQAKEEATTEERERRAAEGDEVEDSETSVALVLLSKDQQRDAWYDEKYGTLKGGRGRSSRMSSGYAAGRSAGQNADIGRSRLGKTMELPR